MAKINNKKHIEMKESQIFDRFNTKCHEKLSPVMIHIIDKWLWEDRA